MASFKRDMPLAEAKELAERFLSEAAKVGITRSEIAGSIRRREPVVGDIDVIVEGSLTLIGQIPGVDVKYGSSDQMTLVYGNQQFNIYRAIQDNWGSFLCFLTGPKGSTIGLRVKAQKRHWLLNQYGLFDGNGVKIASKTEEDIFKALDHPYKEPWMRGKR